MKVCWPEFRKLRTAVSITVISNSSNIVSQRVKPYIGYVLRIEVHRNSPAKCRSGYTKILKSWKEEIVHHLILPGYWLNKLRMLIDMINQAVCVLTHTEEICLFLRRLNFTATVWTFAVNQLGFRKKRFTRSTVKSLIIAFINIPLIIQLFENFLYLGLMILIRCTNKLIIGSVHQIPDRLDLPRGMIYEFLWCYACCLGLFLYLLTVLICSCLEKYIIPFGSLKPGNRIRKHCLIRITNVRFSRRIGNGSGNIIWFFLTIFTHCFSLLYVL